MKKCCDGIIVKDYEQEYQKITIKSVEFILAFNSASSEFLLKLVEEMELKIQFEVTS